MNCHRGLGHKAPLAIGSFKGSTWGMVTGLIIATTCSGCYSTWDVAPKELTKLNGFRDRQKVEIVDQDGDPFVFDRATELSFQTADGTVQDKAKFSSIDINGSMLTGAARGAPRTVSIDLNTLSNIEARHFSVGKTVAAGVIPIGVATILLTAVYISALSSATY